MIGVIELNMAAQDLGITPERLRDMCEREGLQVRGTGRSPRTEQPLTREEHIASHVALHRALDRLMADFLLHNRGAYMSTTTVMQLATWAYEQTKNPTELP